MVTGYPIMEVMPNTNFLNTVGMAMISHSLWPRRYLQRISSVIHPEGPLPYSAAGSLQSQYNFGNSCLTSGKNMLPVFLRGMDIPRAFLGSPEHRHCPVFLGTRRSKNRSAATASITQTKTDQSRQLPTAAPNCTSSRYISLLTLSAPKALDPFGFHVIKACDTVFPANFCEGFSERPAPKAGSLEPQTPHIFATSTC